ncbi:MAG: NusA-like transcription termination signal-binding factor [Thermoproteota archaeon]|jgi:N utilization substance protein A|uniref:Probable transcription termination protein NusA n=2 Tax=Candidatus Methanodesulfokora washburnensis TaxID=2478471 RepID=A0A3R9PW90_9CREN|nr:NusA-like transcription termination signal-binding factor [Candidatus Methanodesulfokores washburnensis]RZN61445.1 MAG: NusA-like transcription termination signal-binding factor [Candidatus Methanodesulfokores washburnensis]TDA41827.1 MAG: NusA-like transcription termination signal-binding factor [Candidatus Korarchaeota archaeon]
MALFESMLGVPAMDVVEDEENGRLIFLVGKNMLGRAVGRGGRKLRAFRDMILKEVGKNVEVVEYNENPEIFLRNLFSPARVTKVIIDEKEKVKTANVFVKKEDKSIAIGRNGRRIKRARLLAKRWLGIENVKIGEEL